MTSFPISTTQVAHTLQSSLPTRAGMQRPKGRLWRVVRLLGVAVLSALLLFAGWRPALAEEGNSSGYSYTVDGYLEQTASRLDAHWTAWFLAQGFAEPWVQVNIVRPGESGFMTCGSQTITDTVNNAYYCSSDANGMGAIWLPVSTFQQMWLGSVFGRTGGLPGDYAAGIITAHEFGHHVQDELFKQWQEKGYDPPALVSTNKNLELIADCFAGSFMASDYYSQTLEAGDFEEAVAALSAIGDAQPGGEFPHGSSQERVAALQLGYHAASPSDCIQTYWIA